MKDKVVLVDWSVYCHKSIILYGSNDKARLERGEENTPIPASWSACNMLFADLARLKLNPDDIIIIAQDGRNNWRKVLDPVYKANRKAGRDKQGHIDWDYWWKKFDTVIENFIYHTPFYPIKIDTLEADDIISASCRYFNDKEVIIVSIDSDYDMLTCFKNVKIFNQKSKEFKIVKDPYGVLASKMGKEVSDNLKTKPVTEKEKEVRNAIVNLIKLPDKIEQLVRAELDVLKQDDFIKRYDIEEFMFKSLIKKIPLIYNKHLDENEVVKKKINKKLKVTEGSDSLI